METGEDRHGRVWLETARALFFSVSEGNASFVHACIDGFKGRGMAWHDMARAGEQVAFERVFISVLGGTCLLDQGKGRFGTNRQNIRRFLLHLALIVAGLRIDIILILVIICVFALVIMKREGDERGRVDRTRGIGVREEGRRGGSCCSGISDTDGGPLRY